MFSCPPFLFHFLLIMLYFTETDLRPRSLSLHIEENRAAHHTSEYEQEELIVRRGQSFKLTVTFDREFNPNADRIVVQLVTGQL